MKVSDQGLEMIRQFEGCRLAAYKCPAGVWTIGYGHTPATQGQCISKSKAEELLLDDVVPIERFINSLQTGLNQNQFDALVCFAYNVGIGNLNRSSLLSLIRRGAKEEAIREQWMRWVHVGKEKSSVLKTRRQIEVDYYFDGK